ncbi:OsmC family protein [Daejeonella oryzae]|uniref:OsmC family protein n=1 Tax=Daejeonella oryzae TaxID=1122943 RepID=UPI0004002A98|nr:OsmC family protein [Daejeonella oryzae]
MALKRRATSTWTGSGLEGSGLLTGPSGVLNHTPYSTKARFQNEDGKDGTNPEELIAAAHAGCFNMALSFQIDGAGFTARELETTSTLTIDKNGNDYEITGIVLNLKGSANGMDEAKFKELAEIAKQNCPVSKVLSSVPITLQVNFIK